MKSLRNERGQSMVEFAIAAPVLVIFLYAIWFVSDLYVAKCQTLMAARYATWRIAALDDLGGGSVALGVRAYYFEENDKVTMEAVSGDEELLSPVSDLLNDVFAGELRPSTFAMNVSYNVAPQLGGLDMSEENPDGFTVGYTHYVGGNSWHGCRTYIHEMYGLFYSYTRRLSELGGG